MRTIIRGAITLALVIAACDRDEIEVVEAPKPVEQVAPAAPENDAFEDLDLGAERARLVRWLDEQTAQLDDKIRELERRGGREAEELAAVFRARRDQVRGKLSELGAITRRNWENFESEVTAAWNRLERDVDEAMR